MAYLQNHRSLTNHRPPTTNHRPTDRRPTDECSTHPPTTDHRSTDKWFTDLPTTDQLTSIPPTHRPPTQGLKLVFFCRNSFYFPKIYERSHIILLFLIWSRIHIRQSELNVTDNFLILFLYWSISKYHINFNQLLRLT